MTTLTDKPSLARFTGDELTGPVLSDLQVRSAAVVICDRARDADDARLLLEACGLIEYPRGDFATYQYGRPKTRQS